MSDSTSPGQHPDYAAPAQPSAPQSATPYGSPQPPAEQYPHAPQYPVEQQYPVTQQYPIAGAQPYPGQQPYVPTRPTSGLAVTSLITGIAGLLLSMAFVPLLASIAAVITGHMALKQIRTNPVLGGRGMAIAGLILGYIGVAFLLVLIVIVIVSLIFVGGALPFFFMLGS